MGRAMKLLELPKRCFQGVMPAVIATCDAQGVPNVTYLSQVFFVDEQRVALSCQFFNKTKQNVLANPYANVELYDPLTLHGYRLDLRYDHAETEGPLFESMSVRIEAIASHTGMRGIFRLLSSDVYDVLGIERIEGLLQPAPPSGSCDEPAVAEGSELAGLQLVSHRICRATDLDELLNSVLEALKAAVGFEHAMVLLPDETGERLFAIASRGYGQTGIGAEVGVGEGLIGTVARERCILRVTGVGAELRYGRAIRASVHRSAGARALAPEIPLPGLVDAQSQMALPLVAGDRLVGVLAVESRSPSAFEEWHEAFLEIIANHVAVAIEGMIQRERDGSEVVEALPPAAPTALNADGNKLARRIKFYPADDCVFVNDEYLVRNVPGKILWSCCASTAIRAGPNSATASCASTRRWDCPRCGTIWKVGWCCCASASNRNAPSWPSCRADGDVSGCSSTYPSSSKRPLKIFLRSSQGGLRTDLAMPGCARCHGLPA
jgi:adenylate cyclase